MLVHQRVILMFAQVSWCMIYFCQLEDGISVILISWTSVRVRLRLIEWGRPQYILLYWNVGYEEKGERTFDSWDVWVIFFLPQNFHIIFILVHINYDTTPYILTNFALRIITTMAGGPSHVPRQGRTISIEGVTKGMMVDIHWINQGVPIYYQLLSSTNWRIGSYWIYKLENCQKW